MTWGILLFEISQKVNESKLVAMPLNSGVCLGNLILIFFEISQKVNECKLVVVPPFPITTYSAILITALPDICERHTHKFNLI